MSDCHLCGIRKARWLLEGTPICGFCRWHMIHHDRRAARLDWTRPERVPMDTLGLRLPRTILKILQIRADRENKTVSRYARELLVEAMADKPR